MSDNKKTEKKSKAQQDLGQEVKKEPEVVIS